MSVSEYRRHLAWTAGKMAAKAGKSRATCNRENGTIYFDDWHDGYNDWVNSNPCQARQEG